MYLLELSFREGKGPIRTDVWFVEGFGDPVSRELELLESNEQLAETGETGTAILQDTRSDSTVALDVPAAH